MTGAEKKLISSGRWAAIALMLAFAGLLAYSVLGHLALPMGNAFSLSPYLFPGLIGLAGTVSAAALFRGRGEKRRDSEAKGGWLPFAVLALGLIFCLGLKIIGFIPSAWVYALASCFLMGERRALALALFPALSAGALYALFKFVFGILL